MRKSVAGFVMFVLPTLVTLGSPAGLKAAQQAKESLGVVLFNADGVDIAADRIKVLAAAARNARATRGECPRGTVTAYVAKGDPLFQLALAQARRDAVRDALAKSGVDVSQFYFRAVVSDSEKITSDTVLTFGAPADETAPTVGIDSNPTPGSRVKAGQQIVVTVTARDDSTRWESGIRAIRLLADSDGGRLVQERIYPPHLPTCEGQPEPRTLQTTYVVPSPTPPIVRLRAIARDHADHEARDAAIVEFPTTGDWYGRIEWSVMGANNSGHRATIDVVVSYDGRGNLTGTATGFEQVAWTGGLTCPERARMSAKVVGQYTPGPNTMSLQFVEPQNTPANACGAKSQFHPVAYGVGIDNNLGNMTARDDGSVEATREKPDPSGASIWRWTVKLKRVPAGP